MHAYTVYGLSVHSELALPWLQTSERDPDVVVRIGAVEGRDPVAGELRYRQDGVVSLSLRDGWLITADPHPGAPQWPLGNAVVELLTVLLDERGMLVLHASAVAVHGAVVAFAGVSGRGKSTLATALHQRGHAMVADDATVVELRDDACMVHAGPPHVSLWPDATAHLTRTANPVPRVSTKFVHAIVAGQKRDALPLHRVYLLTDGRRHAIEPYPPAEAVMALMPHLYRVPHVEGGGLGDVRGRARHLPRFGRLVSSVGVRRLRRVRALESLPALMELVEEDVADARGRSARAPVLCGAGSGDRSGAGDAGD